MIAERIDDFLRRRPTSFRIWIRRKAIERLVDQRRAHLGAKKRTVYKEQPLANSSRFIARQLLTDTPSKVLQRNELQEQVRELIDSLSANDREILTLRHAEGLTNTEVAQLLTIDPNTGPTKTWTRSPVAFTSVSRRTVSRSMGFRSD